MRKTCISLLFDVPYIKSFALCWCMYPSRLRTGCKSSSHFHVNSGCWYSMCCSSLISDAFSKLMQLNKFIFLNWTSVNVTNLCSLKRAPCIDVHIHCLWSPCSPQSQLVEHNWHLFSPVAGSQFGSISICPGWPICSIRLPDLILLQGQVPWVTLGALSGLLPRFLKPPTPPCLCWPSSSSSQACAHGHAAWRCSTIMGNQQTGSTMSLRRKQSSATSSRQWGFSKSLPRSWGCMRDPYFSPRFHVQAGSSWVAGARGETSTSSGICIWPGYAPKTPWLQEWCMCLFFASSAASCSSLNNRGAPLCGSTQGGNTLKRGTGIYSTMLKLTWESIRLI